MEEQSTALTTVNSAVSALASFGFSEDIPMKPSNLILIQKPDEDNPGLTPGKFLDAQANIQYSSLNIVPITMGPPRCGPGRTLFPPDDRAKGVRPICQSRDGINPVRDNPELVPQDSGLGCAKCPMSQWKRINDKRIKPPCAETMSYLIAELETEFIYRFNTKGMGLGPVKDHKDTIRKMVMAAKARGNFCPPYALVFRLDSVRIKGAKGTYYIPKFTPIEPVPADRISIFGAIYEYFNRPVSNDEDGVDAVQDAVDAALQGEYVEPETRYEAA